MRKVLKRVLITALVLCLTGINQLMPVKAETSEFNIVYFGGSATVGEDKYNAWTEQVSDDIAKERSVTVNSFYEGVANTGSEVGQYRAWEKINCNNPDLVFIDFAADDTDIATTKYIENIILTVGSMATPPQIVFVNSARFDGSSAGMLVSNGIEIEKLAEHYGLGTIDMLLRMEMCDDIPSLFESDGITLSQKGHDLFAEEVSSAVLYGDYLKIPNMSCSVYNSGAASVKAKVNTLINSTDGDKTIKFHGSSFIVTHTKGSTGTYEVKIDDTYTKTVTISHSQECIGWAMTNLADADHTAVITATDGSRVNVCEYYTDADAVQYPYINETFEDGVTKAGAVNGATVSIVDDKVKCGDKALRVVSSASSASALSIPVNFQKGKYKVSCYVKTVGFVPKSEYSTFTLVAYSPTASGKTGWSRYVVDNVEYVRDEWVYIETEIENNGQVYCDSAWVDGIAKNSQIQLRIGDKNGNLTNTNDGNAITYEIDNFLLEPICGESAENIAVTATQSANTLECSADLTVGNVKQVLYKLYKSYDGFEWEFADMCVVNDNRASFDVREKALYKVEAVAIDSQDTACAAGESGNVRFADYLFGNVYECNVKLDADFNALTANYTVYGIGDSEVLVILAQYDENDGLCGIKAESVTLSDGTKSFSESIESDADSVKVMIFDGVTSIKPLAECKSERKGE